MVSLSGTEPRKVTINDVARSAGVSRQTVSRALNDKDEIDGSTKQRVLDAARELGYRPSRFARGLVRQDTTTIGLVIPDLLNPFFTEVAAAALEAARARGWHVVVYDTADRAEEELGTLQVIASQVDAVVGYFSCSEDELELFTRGVPVVLIGREHHTARFSSIRIDGQAGVHAAVAHLVAAGHERIGMLDHDGRAEPSIRREWFTTAAAAYGIDAGMVVGADQSADGGGAALKTLLTAHPDVTAVFTFNDIIAIGVLREARRLGRSVPQDLAVIGFDGLQFGALVEPPLSSVALDTRKLGALAIDQVARLLTGVTPLGADDLVVRAELRLGGSA
ncbi:MULTISPECIES: LacI family DNA-binding transcriptional regulator [unclassified Streptomyces]|uniref:LacI family DNA-binding transcriptional regulator n=1 Tax=unclassified Streptomyces TaxID=2593676 RepID=UPI002DDA90E5|nr:MULTISPECIES: LacI family DNA-binding transcriptional regulator [unclassified Streptomyces]WSA81701.1 LacI family transcriptional regulator [Streptomyces sp. NBC_01799]WTD37632.1 LacI family transcriptional regulator [Streptomyces sp. NBC_01643]WSA73185.1 LacI family transcriptional regulator [Streptomyces sp. NBC_01800]WUC17467.1 LacI family transcriptional regulator [Streptomyces sp. NBC_00562]WUC25200.1 LacI family transcriptional regulator [Streptomyces sp. NBC_00562]